MAVKKGTGQMKDTGFSRPYGPLGATAGKEIAKAIKKPTPKPKATPVKKKVLVMPDKISPSKMTPAQKARFLKNPDRYNG